MEATTPTALEMGVEQRIKAADFTAEMVLSDFNQRIQVLSYEARDPGAMVEKLAAEARRRGHGKLFLKAPEFDREALENAGMVREATISGYFCGEQADVMALYLDEDRKSRPYESEQAAILESITSRPADASIPDLPFGYWMATAGPSDAEELATLYATVFASYPFPITDPAYLISTMKTHVVYRIVRDGEGSLVAAASAESCRRYRNAEMTDFATLPSQRGFGLAQHLLAALEDDMLEASIPNLYTIARARSAGMNRVFYNRGYVMTGTLVNNCHIAGRFEDMHAWCWNRGDAQ
ncbi:MAG: putative beta-lysine N-acetyltransferase [Acidobacteriota bacterium]|nr:putative beta-lysine N-acetyltransferase [Acidobacteriota bacterium]